MVAIDLDQAHLDRLDALAKSEGRHPSELAQRIVLDFLDLESLQADSDADWADASVKLSPEILGDESWEDNSDGS